MYSIICCSVNPEEAAALERNIADTIGMPFEFIPFDNREKGYGLVRSTIFVQSVHDMISYVLSMKTCVS